MALVPSGYLQNTKSIPRHIIWRHESSQSYNKISRIWRKRVDRFYFQKKLWFFKNTLLWKWRPLNKRPSGAMDSASGFGSGNSRFKSHYASYYFFVIWMWYFASPVSSKEVGLFSFSVVFGWYIKNNIQFQKKHQITPN